MTTRILALAAALVAGPAGAASGAPVPPPATAPAAAAPDAPRAPERQPKLVLLTGSHLPQRVTKVGRVTDSIQSVTVLTREDLEAAGGLRARVPGMRGR